MILKVTVNSRGIWLLCSRIFEVKRGRIKRDIQVHFNVIPTFALCGTDRRYGNFEGVWRLASMLTFMLTSAVLELCIHLHQGSSAVCQQKTLGALKRDSLACENFKIMVFIIILNRLLMVAEHIVFSAPRMECLSMLRSSKHLDYIRVSNIIRIINWRTMTWTGHVARLGEKEESMQDFGKKSRRKEITRKTQT